MTTKLHISFLASVFFVAMSLPGFSQEQLIVIDNVWKYELKIEGVMDADDAKPPLNILRSTFGAMPTFNTNLQKFVLESRKDKSEEFITGLLVENGFVLTSWSKELNPRVPERDDE